MIVLIHFYRPDTVQYNMKLKPLADLHDKYEFFTQYLFYHGGLTEYK